MQFTTNQKSIFAGIALAILATLIWSGNFVIARGVYKIIPPVSLAFYRWLTASVIIFPIGIRSFMAERKIIWQHRSYFFWVSLSGVTLFNTCIYIAGHYVTAINLALIGTTSSPVFAIILAAIFLGEKITGMRMLGLGLCIAGILLLLSKGHTDNLLSFKFSTGDLFILAGALCFAVYSVLVKRKPAGVSGVNFLFVIFILFILAMFIIENWLIIIDFFF